eukprot:3676546-Pyramimonas_sp.AAC.1
MNIGEVLRATGARPWTSGCEGAGHKEEGVRNFQRGLRWPSAETDPLAHAASPPPITPVND